MFVHVDGKIVFANASLARILRVASPDDLLGKMSFDLLAPEYRARAFERRDDLMRGDVLELEQFEYLRSDGSRVPVVNSGTLVSWDNTPAVLVLIRDVTEREEAAGIEFCGGHLDLINVFDSAYRTTKESIGTSCIKP